MVGQVKKRVRKKPEPVSKFAVGDRVKETRKTVEGFFGISTPPERKEFALKVLGTLREGTVTAVFVKKNTRGDRLMYASVLWDGFKTPSDHAQQRLTRLDETGKLS